MEEFPKLQPGLYDVWFVGKDVPVFCLITKVWYDSEDKLAYFEDAWGYVYMPTAIRSYRRRVES